MQLSTRLKVKRGDTAPPFRAQCLGGDDPTPVNLTGATAQLVLRRTGQAATTRTLVIETGTAGWVHYDWQAADTNDVGSVLAEVEVTFSDQRKQTFPAEGTATIEIVADLNP